MWVCLHECRGWKRACNSVEMELQASVSRPPNQKPKTKQTLHNTAIAVFPALSYSVFKYVTFFFCRAAMLICVGEPGKIQFGLCAVHGAGRLLWAATMESSVLCLPGDLCLVTVSAFCHSGLLRWRMPGSWQPGVVVSSVLHGQVHASG